MCPSSRQLRVYLLRRERRLRLSRPGAHSVATGSGGVELSVPMAAWIASALMAFRVVSADAVWVEVSEMRLAFGVQVSHRLSFHRIE